MKIIKKMKKIYTILLAISFLFIGVAAYAQGLDGVTAGLKSGNAVQITNNSGVNLLLTIAEKGGNYNKQQAQQMLKGFFDKNAVKTFEIKHKGDSPNGRFAIGTLTTANGNYRVNIFMKTEDGKELLKELRFQLIE